MAISATNGGLKRSSNTRDEISPPPTKRAAVKSGTTKNAVNNFFKPASQKEPEKVTWRTIDQSLLIAQYEGSEKVVTAKNEAEKKHKIAAFDLDCTLIRTVSGNVRAKDENDWKWWHPSVPATLQKLCNEGYIVIVLSNQGGISLRNDPKSVKGDMKRLATFKKKVSSVFGQLELPVRLYAATADDQNRKPRTGMWHEMLEDFDLEIGDRVDMLGSFLVGDAAGRIEAGVGQPKDFACSDRDFATNVGVHFYTPEEYFLKETPREYLRSFDPLKYVTSVANGVENKPSLSLPFVGASGRAQLVLLCGSPGSGKSTFYWKHLMPRGYERVNQDILKSRDKCMKKATEFIEDGKSVCVDNTNANKSVRAKWVELADTLKASIHCVYLTTPAEVCEHNDTVRALNQAMNPEERIMLPKMAFRGFSSNFQAPILGEGFKDITRVDFKFAGTEEQQAIWSKYWT